MTDFLHTLAKIYGINRERKKKHTQTRITDFILISKEREDWKRYYDSKFEQPKPSRRRIRQRRFKIPITHGFIRLHFAVQDYVTAIAYSDNVNVKEIAKKNSVRLLTLINAIGIIARYGSLRTIEHTM